MDNEIWKPVVGFEESYIVSNKGRIKSLFKGVFLAYMAGSKSLSVRLFDSKTKNKYRKQIASLVLEAFVEPSNGREPKYLDGNPKNCNLENLYWDNNSVKVEHVRGYTVSKYINILCYYEGNIVGAFKTTGDINKFLKEHNINSRTDNLTRAIRLKTTYKCMEYKVVSDDEFNEIKTDNLKFIEVLKAYDEKKITNKSKPKAKPKAKPKNNRFIETEYGNLRIISKQEFIERMMIDLWEDF